MDPGSRRGRTRSELRDLLLEEYEVETDLPAGDGSRRYRGSEWVKGALRTIEMFGMAVAPIA